MVSKIPQPRLPELDGKKRLITSALPYVNNVPHLGNIIGCVLSADVYSRFCKSRGYETLYICGTDEYGTATETKALEEGVTPKEICDKYYAVHKSVYEWFNIQFDAFGRTSDPEHTEITQLMFNDLDGNGFIVEDELEQLWSPKLNMFLADRYVKGTCPNCGYDDARGDQCENCGNMLNAIELENPVSAMEGDKLEKKSSTHLFVDLPKLVPQLKPWVEKQSKEGKWSQNSVTMTDAWIRDGLKIRCITRDLKWGVPVPKKGFEDKVFYVWFDACIGYISITAHHFKEWKDWWQDPKNTKLYQFMGKDNVPFHTVLFPSSMLGGKQNWTMLHHISTTEYLNYESGKFSKTRGTGVFGTDAVESGIPADVYRYYLLMNRPETSDSLFNWDDFQDRLNRELLANYGNLVNRTLTFLSNNFDGKIPEHKLRDSDIKFLESHAKHMEKVTELLEDVKLRDGLKQIMAASKDANQYFQEQQPWALVKEDKDAAAAALVTLATAVRDLSIAIEPYIPATSQSVYKQLGLGEQTWSDIGNELKASQVLGKPEHLFQKLDEKTKKSLREKFSGQQSKDESTEPDVPKAAKIKFVVAEIKEVEKHPDADKLYIEKIDLGNELRTIVSGLAGHYTTDELVGKKIVLVANLKPAQLRGVESQGMLLCAEDKEGKLELIEPDGNPGDVVELKGVESAHEKQITIDQFFKVKLKAVDGTVQADGVNLTINGSNITSKKILNGKVR